MLVYCWPTIYDADTTLIQHWMNVLCCCGTAYFYVRCMHCNVTLLKIDYFWSVTKKILKKNILILVSLIIWLNLQDIMFSTCHHRVHWCRLWLNTWWVGYLRPREQICHQKIGVLPNWEPRGSEVSELHLNIGFCPPAVSSWLKSGLVSIQWITWQ